MYVSCIYFRPMYMWMVYLYKWNIFIACLVHVVFFYFGKSVPTGSLGISLFKLNLIAIFQTCSETADITLVVCLLLIIYKQIITLHNLKYNQLTVYWEFILEDNILVRCTDTELRFFARSFCRAVSALSARSSESSNSCCTFLYLARLTAAISSCYDKNYMVNWKWTKF